jgi:carbamate kinase
LLTRVEVAADDPAFQAPTKPIGPVYAKTEADAVVKAHGWAMIEEASGHLRRVVPSPLPLRILSVDAIKLLMGDGQTVICAGGGGIPVVRGTDGMMKGVEAVIDKDRTAALLAQELQADALLLLTDVAAVFRDFGSASQSAIGNTTPLELGSLDFAAGSMGPKVSAACDFVKDSGMRAGIGQLSDALAILEGRKGTLILPDPATV